MIQDNRRHGYRLVCQTCTVKNVAGGEDDTKKFAKRIREQLKRHRGHQYELKQSYHAAELAHDYAEQTTKQTQANPNNAYFDVSGAAIASTEFTAGKKYLIYISGTIDGTSTTAEIRFRVLHGSTAFADSEHIALPISAAANDNHYSWWTVWTAVSGEGIKMQFGAGSLATTVGMDNISIASIKLSDDLVENTDWGFTETAASTSLTTSDSSANNATLSTTPSVANTPVLVLVKNRVDATASAASVGIRIVRSGEASSTGPFATLEPRSSVTDFFVHSLARVYNCGTSSNTFTEKSYSTASNNHTRLHSGIFYLHLNKLRNNSWSYSDSSVTDLVANTPVNYGTNIATTTITPDVAGDVWSFGFTTLDANGQNAGWRCRLQVDDTDQPPTQTTDSYNVASSNDTTDEMAFSIHSIDSLTAAAHTIDLDGSVGTAVAGRGCRAKLVFAVTMELPSTGVAITEVQDEPVPVTEAANMVLGKIKSYQENLLIGETTAALLTKIRTVTESLLVGEGSIKNLALLRVVNETLTTTEARNILRELTRIFNESTSYGEAVNRLRTLARIITESAAIGEQLARVLGFFKVKDEALSVQEAFDVLAQRTRVKDESLAVQEAYNVLMQKTRVISEFITFGEQLEKLAQRIRVANENLSVGEAYNIARNLLRIQEEQLQVLETYVPYRGLSRTIDETIEFLHHAQVNLTLGRVISEALALAEALNYGLGKTRLVNESFEISELTNAIITEIAEEHKKVVDESLNISELINYVMGKVRVKDEPFNVSEAAPILLRDLKRMVNESIPFVESINRLAQYIRTVNEDAHLSETETKLQALLKVYNETAEFAETAQVIRGLTRLLNEAIDLPETQLSALGKSHVVSEVYNILEQIVTKIEEQVIPPGPAEPVISGTMALSPQRRRRFPTIKRRRMEFVRTYQKRTPTSMQFEAPKQQVPDIKDLAKRPEIKDKDTITVESTLTLRWKHLEEITIDQLLEAAITKSLTRETLSLARARTIQPVKEQPAIILKDIVKSSVNLRYAKTQLVESSLSIRYNTSQQVEAEPPLTIKYQTLNTVESSLSIRYNQQDGPEYDELQELKSMMEDMELVTANLSTLASLTDASTSIKSQQRQLLPKY